MTYTAKRWLAVLASWSVLAIWSGSDPLPEPDITSIDHNIESMTGLSTVRRINGWLFQCSYGELGNYAFASSDGTRGVLCTSAGGQGSIREDVLGEVGSSSFRWFCDHISGPLLPVPVLFLLWGIILRREDKQ
jgi:hypothetical protein